MNNACKTYLISFIYEEIAKGYYNALHSKNNEGMEFYQNLLKEIENKKIKSDNLKVILTNMKEAYAHRMIDMPIFIENLLIGNYINDRGFAVNKDRFY